MELNNISSQLFDWLTPKFTLAPPQDENGKETSDPEKMRIFNFPFKDADGHESDIIQISILDDKKTKNTVKVYYDQDLLQHFDTQQSNEFSKFLDDLKYWAHSRMLGFDIRDNATTIQQMRENSKVVQESKFTNLDGTVKTSMQRLPHARLVIKHSESVCNEVRGARSRKIHKIYVINDNNERFLLPVKNLKGARAQARHVDQGGNPYDETGKAISTLAKESQQLSKFVRRTSSKLYEDEVAQEMIESAITRLSEVRKILTSLCSERGYKQNVGNLSSGPDSEYTEDVKQHFTQSHFDSQLDESLPYVWKAYQSNKKITEAESKYTPEQIDLGAKFMTISNSGVEFEYLVQHNGGSMDNITAEDVKRAWSEFEENMGAELGEEVLASLDSEKNDWAQEIKANDKFVISRLQEKLPVIFPGDKEMDAPQELDEFSQWADSIEEDIAPTTGTGKFDATAAKSALGIQDTGISIGSDAVDVNADNPAAIAKVAAASKSGKLKGVPIKFDEDSEKKAVHPFVKNRLSGIDPEDLTTAEKQMLAGRSPKSALGGIAQEDLSTAEKQIAAKFNVFDKVKEDIGGDQSDDLIKDVVHHPFTPMMNEEETAIHEKLSKFDTDKLSTKYKALTAQIMDNPNDKMAIAQRYGIGQELNSRKVNVPGLPQGNPETEFKAELQSMLKNSGMPGHEN